MSLVEAIIYLILVADLECIGFCLNPYEPCMANKEVDGAKMTMSFHVDDIKVSHLESREVDKIIEWFKSIYGNNVRVSCGTTHDYL